MTIKEKVFRILFEEHRKLFEFCYKEGISQEELDGDEEATDEGIYAIGRIHELNIIQNKLRRLFNEKSSKQNGK